MTDLIVGGEDSSSQEPDTHQNSAAPGELPATYPAESGGTHATPILNPALRIQSAHRGRWQSTYNTVSVINALNENRRGVTPGGNNFGTGDTGAAAQRPRIPDVAA